MTIAILCPTKGRPEQFRRMVDSASKTAAGEIIYYQDVQGDHYNSIDALQGKTLSYILSSPDMLPTVYRWNRMALLAMNHKHCNLFMLAADDIVFATPLWDKAIIDHYNALDNKIHVYALQDSRDPEGTPHQIVTREYIEAMGYFCPPIFLHWHTDTWTTEIAKANGVFTHMKDYLLIHDKPSDRGEPDATHTGIRAQGWHERDQYVAKTCGHFLDVEKKRLASIIQKWKIDRMKPMDEVV